ncbi:hypothetical protein KP509_21G047400 [Ceratopteris richardii]|uniref:DUF1995 domain-containing protein n=1 Tax=Ceratopteris richardii TaxID=49495 RepID=A0A8T2S9M3_CERRI|nr:hypothetical protein KP509_21G047400 [Ceratopteris richardii]
MALSVTYSQLPFSRLHKESPYVDLFSVRVDLSLSIQKTAKVGNSSKLNLTRSGRQSCITMAVNFPVDYEEVLEQAKVATKAALNDEKKLLEVEFPTAGLESVSGDAEGGIEMTSSMVLIRDFCLNFLASEQYARTRIFFPDINEVEAAKVGIFEGTFFKLDYLTKPSGLEDIGFGEKVRVVDHLRPTDEMIVVAYPYFNVNEMLAVEELYTKGTAESKVPILVFNGELDRIRSGYYPPFFYPKLAALSKSLLPKFETVYYIHNFKGSRGGALFRAYPGPWKVFRRGSNGLVCIHEQETMPSLKEVALDILMRA